jgi:hypothetical protein
VDTTSFAVTGEYAPDLDAHTLAVTYGYSRDHRADLKQPTSSNGCWRWQRPARAMCRSSARHSMATPVTRRAWSPPWRRWRTSCVPPQRPRRRAPLFVADSALAVADDTWEQAGDLFWVADRPAPTGERWVVVRTAQGEDRVRTTLRRQVDKTWEQWAKAFWHLGNQRFTCAPDAQAALTKRNHSRRACRGW